MARMETFTILATKSILNFSINFILNFFINFVLTFTYKYNKYIMFLTNVVKI